MSQYYPRPVAASRTRPASASTSIRRQAVPRPALAALVFAMTTCGFPRECLRSRDPAAERHRPFLPVLLSRAARLPARRQPVARPVSPGGRLWPRPAVGAPRDGRSSLLSSKSTANRPFPISSYALPERAKAIAATGTTTTQRRIRTKESSANHPPRVKALGTLFEELIDKSIGSRPGLLAPAPHRANRTVPTDPRSLKSG